MLIRLISIERPCPSKNIFKKLSYKFKMKFNEKFYRENSFTFYYHPTQDGFYISDGPDGPKPIRKDLSRSIEMIYIICLRLLSLYDKKNIKDIVKYNKLTDFISNMSAKVFYSNPIMKYPTSYSLVGTNGYELKKILKMITFLSIDPREESKIVGLISDMSNIVGLKDETNMAELFLEDEFMYSLSTDDTLELFNE